MILNKKYLFVHVPKTGGTSITSLLEEYSVGKTEQYYEQHEILFVAYKQLSDEEFDNRFKFGFVRNPFDREVSNYFWHTKANDKIDISFTDWVKWRYDEMNNSISLIEFSNRDAYYYNKGFAKTPQTGFFVNNQGKIIADFIGRYETLQEDWSTVAEKLNLPRDLPHNYKTERENDYRIYYNDETRAIIENAHQIDLSVFNYDFDKGLVSKDINTEVEVSIHLSGNYNYYYG